MMHQRSRDAAGVERQYRGSTRRDFEFTKKETCRGEGRKNRRGVRPQKSKKQQKKGEGEDRRMWAGPKKKCVGYQHGKKAETASKKIRKSVRSVRKKIVMEVHTSGARRRVGHQLKRSLKRRRANRKNDIKTASRTGGPVTRMSWGTARKKYKILRKKKELFQNNPADARDEKLG